MRNEKCLKVLRLEEARVCKLLPFRVWLFRSERCCHINGIKFQQFNGVDKNMRSLEVMAVANGIEVEESKGLKKLHLFCILV